MAFSDPNGTHNPSTGAVIPASWGDIVRDDLMALYGPARVRVHRGSVQSIPHNTSTLVLFDSELTDSHSMHSTVSNTGRLTIPTGWSGDWIVGATVKWEPSVAGTFRHAEILVNGAVLFTDSDADPGASGYCTNNLADLWIPAAGDYLTLHVKQDTGGNLNVQPNSYGGVIFWAAFVGSGAG